MNGNKKNGVPTPGVRRSRFGKKDLTKENKHIIANVYRFFENLAENPELAKNLNFRQIQKLTADACGVSKTTVNKIKQAMDASEGQELEFNAPRETFKKVYRVTGLDDFQKEIVRRSVISFYERGECPSADAIRIQLEKEIDFKGSNKSVLRILRKLGFRYRKCNDGKKFLIEKRDISSARAAFLRKMHAIKNDATGRTIFYLGEKWVNQNCILQNLEEKDSLKIPADKGAGRLVILHVGSSNTGELKFRSANSSLNIDCDMNAKLFKEWFVNFLTLLEDNSVIVMNNTSYNCIVEKQIPKTNWKKADIQEWLKKYKIPFTAEETRDELLNKIEIKNAPKIYEIDTIAFEMGHEVIRLPPYHGYYNPIEMIWKKIQNEITDIKKCFKLAEIDMLLHQAITRVTVEDWTQYVRLTENLQEKDYHKQCERDKVIEPYVQRLAEDSSDDSSSDYDSGDEERDRDRDRERKRRRSRSRDKDRDRTERKRDRRDRERDRRDRDRDRGDRLEYIKTDEGGEIRIKEEPIDDYPDYSQYQTQPYDQSQIKYEEEDEKKFQIPDNTNGGRGNYDDYEEGEAY